MRYLLVVGFACDVYRREPRARIFVGDRLVDEFHIPHTSSNFFSAPEEFFKKSHPLQPFSWTEINNLRIKNLTPLKFYELQINNEVRDLAIRIDIDNTDSNYNNGYITRSTSIRLEMCSFFPLEEKLLRRLKKINDRRRSGENYILYRSRKNTLKNVLFNLVENGMIWKGANGQKITNISSSVLNRHNIGGNGEYVCYLAKKYGIFMPTLARACRYDFNYDITNYFFDKYQQYANQGNTD